MNLDIGRGLVLSGSFSSIDWSLGPYFIETGLDISGGSSFSIMSTNELMGVHVVCKTSGGGPQGPPEPGATGAQGPSSIIQQTVLSVGNCPNGGLLIESGTDLDTNNILSPSEVTSSGYVCNGDDAQDNRI